MGKLGIALDLGTSGFRAQAMELEGGGIVSTAVTTRHPLPGANVMDHLHAALEMGTGWAHRRVAEAVERVVAHLGVDRSRVARVAVCGNPIQLSLFQGMEIRDLAYAGKRKLEALGVESPDRDARVGRAGEIPALGLPEDAEILIPPAVRHEIGADALAMMLQTGMLERDEVSIATDYGTNAEMALVVGGTVYTGSTAAGPALEGQQIEDGLLALPGAISDVELAVREGGPGGGAARSARSLALSTWILGDDMVPLPGDTVDPVTGRILAKGAFGAVGITGTGVIALLSQGMRTGLIRVPRVEAAGGEIRLPDGLRFTEADLREAGKAVGSIRAGHVTLCHEAGIRLQEIETAYMSGASGTYVDARKAYEIGLVPAGVKRICQVGNTSLAMARDLVRDPDELRRMQEAADTLRQTHCMFAASKTFERVYILELSHWTEGMPFGQYQALLTRYGLPPLPEPTGTPQVVRTVDRDIPDLGRRGLRIVTDLGARMTASFEGCLGEGACAVECPEGALELERADGGIAVRIDPARCNGVACRRCERVCAERVFDLVRLLRQGPGG